MAMVQEGIDDLLITTEIVGKPKLDRLVRLVQQSAHLKVVVDSLEGARMLNQALVEAGQQIKVLLNLNVGQNRCGVLPGEEALHLARSLRDLKHLHPRGIQGYEEHLQHLHDPEERARRKPSGL